MRALRSLSLCLLFAGAHLASSGCSLVALPNSAQRSSHLPRVEVELPGRRTTSSQAPEWRPAPPVTAPARATATDAPLSPATQQPSPAPKAAQELRQVLDQLVAEGALERAQHSELVKNLEHTDPATLAHLLWMYRLIAQAPQPKSPTAASAEHTVVRNPRASTVSTVAANMAVASDEPNGITDSEPGRPAPLDDPTTLTAPRRTGVTTELVAAPARSESRAPVTPLESALPIVGESTALEPVIRALERATDSAPVDEQAKLHAQLRMLYLAAGRKHDAIRPIPGLAEPEQDFLSKELYGLATYLDEARVPDPARRAAEASRHLREALQRLSETSPLLVRNLAFCSEVSSYGVYTAFGKQEFKPAQQVLLYVEVENFKSEETPKGYHTAFKSHYQLLDAQGRKVDEHDFELAEERCQNPRRDYFLRYFVTLPGRIYDGRYTLQLTVEDTLAKKIGQSTIEFTIKSK